jgi:hypothetical protein
MVGMSGRPENDWAKELDGTNKRQRHSGKRR